MVGILSPKAWLAIGVLALLVFTHLFTYRAGSAAVRADWHAERLATQKAAQEQQERNLELQRASEKRYVVQAEVREKYIVETIVEVRRETQAMAVCPVPEPARRLLNDAARCARENSPAACGTGEPVRGAARPS